MEVQPEVNADKTQVPLRIGCLVTTMQDNMANERYLIITSEIWQSSLIENHSKKRN
jgi:hypothetical protein